MEVLEIIEQGENSSVEFKSAAVRPNSIAKEMAAFSNTYGGLLVIGVEDDHEITGVVMDNIEEWIANIARNNIVPAISPVIRMETISDKLIAVVEVPKGISKPYQTLDGKYWIRVGSTNRSATKEELSRLFQQAGLVHFDLSPVEGTSQRDFDDNRLADYWKTYYHINYFQLEKEEQKKILVNSDTLIPFEHGYAASVGGLLIFGRDPQRRLPHASIKTAVFKGTEITDDLIDKKEIKGNLPELIENTVSLIKLFLPLSSVVNGMKREEKRLVPDKVLREVIVNAVCHRDYSISNRFTTVYMFSNRIEITSPGRLGNTLTLDKIKTGNSEARNHFLLKFLDNMRYIDGLGRGVPMMIRAMKENISLEEAGELFRVTLTW